MYYLFFAGMIAGIFVQTISLIAPLMTLEPYYESAKKLSFWLQVSFYWFPISLHCVSALMTAYSENYVVKLLGFSIVLLYAIECFIVEEFYKSCFLGFLFSIIQLGIATWFVVNYTL